MEEPNVLDWLIEKLKFWKKKTPAESVEVFPDTRDLFADEPVQPVIKVVAEKNDIETRLVQSEDVVRKSYRLPWRTITALLFGLIGQWALGPENRKIGLGVALFFAAIALLLWGHFSREWDLLPQLDTEAGTRTHKSRKVIIGLAIVFLLLAFLLLGGNSFNIFNLLLWLLAIIYVMLIFIEISPRAKFADQFTKFLGRFKFPWKFQINGFSFLFILALIVSSFYRLYHLNQVPLEMISDQAEKLLDIGDVLNGQFSIFFPRNTGREAFQMYWTALVSLIFGTGLSFLSLKIGAAIAGLFTLPFIYLIGKELGSKWGGLAGMFFGGIAYWPNVITRIGLRFTYYPAFTAPALYFFLRGLRRSSRNDMIWAGMFLGLGLHGYTPMRIVPFLIVMMAILFIFSKIGRQRWKEVLIQVGILALISAAVALPLLRFASEYPDLVALRAFSRLGDINNPLPGSAASIFGQNFWKASIMFFWSNGDIWPHSVPNYPALDFGMAVLYLFGCVMLLLRFIRTRNWQDISILISIPILMMPSILSLAYPGENPSLNRTAAAFIPVTLVAGLAFETIIRAIWQPANGGRGKWLAALTAGILILIMMVQNYNLVFDKYDSQYRLSAWNTTEIGGVIKQFTDTVGSEENAWVVGYPYWVDTRLVAYNAGFPGKDFAIWPDQYNLTLEKTGPKLFILYPEDKEGLSKLQTVYPTGAASMYDSPTEGKDFMVFYVPAEGSMQP